MKTIPAELSAKIDEIKSWMVVPGDQEKVAAKARTCRETVNRVLNKRAFSDKVIEAGIEVMNENKRRFEISASMRVA
jgi:CRP-like cAMP-binding protein